jgi:hypothetical protein
MGQPSARAGRQVGEKQQSLGGFRASSKPDQPSANLFPSDLEFRTMSQVLQAVFLNLPDALARLRNHAGKWRR